MVMKKKMMMVSIKALRIWKRERFFLLWLKKSKGGEPWGI